MFIKSGDSSNFLNATQGVDALVEGFGAGIEAFVQRRREQIQHAEEESVQAEDPWEAYAHALERQNAQLVMKVALLEKDYVKLESKLNAVQSTFGNYNAALVSRIQKLDEALQGTSANEFAYNKMRCRLIEKIQALGDPAAAGLISEEAQIKELKEDWDYFMKHKDVRGGVPDVMQVMRKVGAST